MDKKSLICIAIMTFFVGLGMGLNIGGVFEVPGVISVACLVIGSFFGGLAVNFNQKDKKDKEE